MEAILRDEQIIRLEEMDQAHWWTKSRLRLISKIVRAQMPTNSYIFEIGAGSGGSLKHLRDSGFRVSALEPTKYGANICRELGIDVHSETIESLKVWPKNIDLIMMLDVLEHIENDKQALAIIHEKTSSHTKLMITVPNDQRLWSKLDEDVFHFRRYEFDNLQEALNAAGWKVIYWQYWMVLLKPIVKFRRRIMRGDFTSETKKPNFLLNKLLYFICVAENLIPFVKNISGTSIIMFCEKNSDT